MIQGKKLIVVTPAGRKQYLEILANLVLRERDVDEWHIWVNTTDPSDLEYINHMPEMDGRIILKTVTPDHSMEPIMRQWNLHLFYNYCMEDAVYLRIDDDICYIEPGAINKLAYERLTNVKPFIIYGNVLNNSLMTAIHTRLGTFPAWCGIPKYETFDEIALKNGEFFMKLHEQVMQDMNDKRTLRYKFNKWVLSDYEHHSITVSAFLGKTMKEVGGVTENDEIQLNIDIPKKLGVYNEVCGGALFVHHQYYYQREDLKSKGIDPNIFLDEYLKLSLLK
jgi:hypothetical protein